MRPLVLFLCRGLLCASMPFASIAQQGISTTSLLQAKQSSFSLPSNVSQSWFQQATQHLQEREYFMQQAEAESFGAANRAQRLAYFFSPSGYRVKPLLLNSSDTAPWEVSFAINGIGRGGQLTPPRRPTTIVHNDNEIIYHYDGFSAQYINDERGMRQNFIVQRRPTGEDKLRLQLAVSGDLEVSVTGPDKIALHEAGNGHSVKMVYDQLRAWDVNNRPVAARFVQASTGQIDIIADDQGAVYPITIDPLNHTPGWTDNGNGLLLPLVSDLTVPLLFGLSVSGAGDVNNDGFDDIIIGAPGYVDILSVSGGTFNAVSVGAAFLYYGSGGSPGGPAVNPTEVLQPTSQLGALFGYSVSAAGDLNGDGFDDVVVGAPADRVNLNIILPNAAIGKLYVYYGGATFDGNVNTEPTVSVNIGLRPVDFSLAGLTSIVNPLFGFSVSSAGSVNGDGYADLIVGSPAYLSLIAPTVVGGRVDIYHGSATGIATTPTHTIVGNLVGGLFGYSVSTAGNVNGDAYSDVIVGAPASIGLFPVSVGRAYVFHGASGGITATSAAGANIALTAPPSGLLTQTLFGLSVSNAGDVNADGYGDVIVGEPLSPDGAIGNFTVAGKAHIFYGSATGLTLANTSTLTSPRSQSLIGSITGVSGNLLYGFSVDSAGDVNCDGINDLIIGEPGSTAIGVGSGLVGLANASVISGKVYIYYGRAGTGPLNSPSYLIQETSPLSVANLLGASVSAAGDVNGDGRADFLIGAPNGTLNLGGSLLNIIGTAIGVVTNNSVGSSYSYFGCLAAVDLDFDNDGVPDAIDLDDDNDGTPDMAEYPGMILTSDPSADNDGDGIPNFRDADYTFCGSLNANGICTAFDKDGDGVPNHFDIDSDNDGIPDVIEAGGVDTNGDGILDNFSDADADGLATTIDLTPTGGLAGSGNGLTAPDFDGDGIPNNLDLDSDGDGISDLREAGLPDADNNGLIDGFADADGDGLANSIDPKNGHSGISDPAGPGTASIQTPTDTDANGRYNGNPTVDNADNDARFNFLDADSDNDGITDNVEAQATSAYVLPLAVDTDLDGLANVYEGPTGGGITPNDQDSDGTPDYLDSDSDNDGMPDMIEGHDYNLNGINDDNVVLSNLDTDGDGIDNNFDLAAGPNVTTAGMGTPPIPGSRGPLQARVAFTERDWRNSLIQLPIILASFTGRLEDGVVVLDWATASEQHASHFEVQRSGDGSSFEPIGKVAAQGNSNQVVNYTFTDPQPLAGMNYYRLRMVDIDQRSTLSKVVLIRQDRAGRNITVAPNPVRDQVQVVWNRMPAGKYKIELVNSNGQLVKTLRTIVNSTNQVMVIPREAGWLKGNYVLRFTTAKERQVIKIVLE